MEERGEGDVFGALVNVKCLSEDDVQTRATIRPLLIPE